MPNKTKAKIRHSKLKAKAENAATESFKKDGGIQKNKRLVTKANKLNQRKNLGLPNIAYGMTNKTKGNPLTSKERIDLEKKEAANIKKQKEASKSNPQFGREEYKKMYGEYPTHDYGRKINGGYQMDSSHSFKGNVANNMKTLYMGSVYYQTDPPSEENGEIINTGESLQQKIGEDEQIKQVIKKKTVPGKVIGGGYEDKMSNEAWEQYLANETPEQKEARIKREIADGVRQPNQVIQVKSEEKSKVPVFGEIKQEFDATGNFGRRQQMRGAIAQERKQKRYKIRMAKAQAKKEGKQGKEYRKAVRDARNDAKFVQNQNVVARGNEIARQTEMQEQQGIIGPNSIGSDGKVRKIKQDFTPGVVSGTGRNTKRYIQQMTKQQAQAQAQASGSKGLDKKALKSAMGGFGFFMDLPPKATKHFNRKNKK